MIYYCSKVWNLLSGIIIPFVHVPNTYQVRYNPASHVIRFRSHNTQALVLSMVPSAAAAMICCLY